MDFFSLIPQFGGFFWTVAAFVVALSIIVTIHEYGHYIIGRLSGIHAEVFSLGFGPTLWSRLDRHGTRWQVAALPLGGYVKFLGDANAASAGADMATMSQLSDAEKRRTMHGAPLWARAATVAAGPIFNFILSIVVFTGLYIWSGAPSDAPMIGTLKDLPGGYGTLQPGDQILSIDGKPTPDWETLSAVTDELPAQALLPYEVLRNGQKLSVEGPFPQPPLALSIVPDSAAMEAGLKAGDVILTAQGSKVVRFADLQNLVRSGNGAPVALSVWRAGKTFDVTLTPRKLDVPTQDGGFETSFKMGISGYTFFEPVTRRVGPGEAVLAAAKQSYYIAKTSLSGLALMATGKISACNLRGPIGIAESSGDAASQGLTAFLGLIALLSTSIGLLNLFPIPMLDGGHLVFYAYEWAVGKPLPARALEIASSIGLFLVLGLMIFGLTNDFRC